METSKKGQKLAEWVNLYTADLLSWASYKVSDAELAKDLVQDTFLAASEKMNSFRGESSPKTWLFSILNYKVIDFYRSKMRKPLADKDDSILNFFNADGEWINEKKPVSWDDQEVHLLDNEDFNMALRACMEALPEKWNISIRLKYILGKKGEEICQEIGVTPTNLWQIMHRAKLQLRECLENNWFKEGVAQ